MAGSVKADRRYIRQAWLVLVLSGCFGAALAGVQATLSGKIDQNKRSDMLGQVPSLVPGASRGEELTVGEQIIIRATSDSGNLVGWVVPAMGQGFADTIELLVGLDAKAQTITGLYVLSQKETPGLGDKVESKAFRSQFAGQSAGSALRVVKEGPAVPGAIRALSGATISSTSVADIVNDAVARFRTDLAAGKVKE